MSCTDDTDHFEIGFAVSDPYLAYALPIHLEEGNRPYELHVPRPETIGTPAKAERQTITWTTLPETSQELMESLGYSDVGGVALALPMKTQRLDQLRKIFHDLHLNGVRDSIRQIVRNYQGEDTRRFNLQCYVQDRLTWEEAKEMAKNEPEIWEEVDFESKSEARSSLRNSAENRHRKTLVRPVIFFFGAILSFRCQKYLRFPNVFGTERY
jgi:hypothetical protein